MKKFYGKVNEIKKIRNGKQTLTQQLLIYNNKLYFIKTKQQTNYRTNFVIKDYMQLLERERQKYFFFVSFLMAKNNFFLLIFIFYNLFSNSNKLMPFILRI